MKKIVSPPSNIRTREEGGRIRHVPMDVPELEKTSEKGCDGSDLTVELWKQGLICWLPCQDNDDLQK